MSQLVYFGSAGASGANQNLNNNYQTLGKGANGDGVTLTASASLHTKGNFSAIGTPSADLAGFVLWVGPASASGARLTLDIRRNAAAMIVQDLYLQPGANTGWRPIYCPLNVPAGQEIDARIQSSAGSATLRCFIEGIERNSQSAPLFSEMVALMVDTANTRAGTVDVPLTNTWTELLSTTGEAFPAFMASAGISTSNPAGVQSMTIELGTGAASSEVHLTDFPTATGSTDPRVPLSLTRAQEKPLPNARVAARILAGTPGSDNLRVGLYGLRA